LSGRPRLGARQRRHPARVGDLGALAVAAPAPVVERAGDGVALDRAVGEIAAHVGAEGVEHVELPVFSGEHDELGAERGDLMRLAVGEVADQAEAMPPAGVPLGRQARVDDAGPVSGCGRGSHGFLLGEWAASAAAMSAAITAVMSAGMSAVMSAGTMATSLTAGAAGVMCVSC